MPYKSIQQLPPQIKNPLPKGAQQIFKSAFNNAYKEYKNPESPRGNTGRDATARKVAWSAVKSKYRKQNGKWVRKKLD